MSRRTLTFRERRRREAAGLKTAVGIPILSGDKVIAVIEFFMRESRSENEQLVKVIAAVAAQLDLLMERKRAAEELSRTNEILRSILSNMGDAVIVADKEGNFLVFNPAAERMFGTGANEKCRLANGRIATVFICRTRSLLFPTINCL